MDSDLRERIVLVRAGFENREEKVGTGFRLAPGRVLTSQHVVRRVGESSKAEAAVKIEVEVDLGDDRTVRRPATLLWAGEPGLRSGDLNARDAALLEDELPGEGLPPFSNLVWEPLASTDWDSAGYARDSPGFEIARPDELAGSVGAVKPHEAYLELTVRRRAPAGGWAGVSGAPVFVASGFCRGYLYGVVRKHLPDRTDTLYAVSIPHLLNDAEFRRHLGIEDRRDRAGKIVDALRKLFEKDRELAARTARAHPAWSEGWEKGAVEGLLQAMSHQGSLEVLENLRQLYLYEARAGGRADYQQAARLLSSLISGRTVHVHAEDREGRRLSVRASSPNLAELGVASRDGRPCSFVAVAGDLPRARLRAPLSTTLDGGIGLEQKAADQQHLLDDYLFNVMNEMPWIYPEWVKELERRAPADKRRGWIEALNRRLRRIAADYRRSPYVVVEDSFRGTFKEQATPFLKKLRETFPDLRQIELRGDPDHRFAEDDQLDPLWRILDLLTEETDL